METVANEAIYLDPVLINYFVLVKAEARLPFGRLVKAEEAARAIAWLASRESGMMTGALVDFDQAVIGAGDVPRPSPGESGTE